MKTLFGQVTYVIILIVIILLMMFLFYVNHRMRVITDDNEQKIAWQTLNNAVEKANFLFEKNETAYIEVSKFASSLENDTALLHQTLTQLLQNNHDLRAVFICFYDSTLKQNVYLTRDKNHIEKVSFNDYISDIKQKSLHKHFNENHLKPFWENPIISSTENQACSNLFVPFADKSNQLKGFVGFNMSLAWIDDVLHSELTYYKNDALAFMFMLDADGIAISTTNDDIIKKNSSLIDSALNNNAVVSTLYSMRNGETESIKLKTDYTKTTNMFFYKSLTNKQLSIALSYYKNQSMNAWTRLFVMITGTVLFFFGIISLWLWWYWKKRVEMIDKIERCLAEIEEGSTTALIPSSLQHQDLAELCVRIESMQRGIDRKNHKIVLDTKAIESKDKERELALYIRRYFYSPQFQYYDASLSRKIYQHIKTSYLLDVGGDFHDYFHISPQLIGFVTGTVSRPKKSISNIQTAIDILMTMSLIRSHLKAYSSLRQAVYCLNNDLYSQNNGNFTVNAFIGVLNCETGILEFVSAGAPTHYMISHRSIFSFPVQHGLSFASIPNEEYTVGSRELSNGDMLLAHTAGVLSRQNNTGEKYGQSRLEKVMSAYSMMDPATFLERIVKDISIFTESYFSQVDDYTLLAIKYEEKK